MAAIAASLATLVAAAVPALPALLSAQRTEQRSISGGKFVRQGADDRPLAVTWPSASAASLDDGGAFAPPILQKDLRTVMADAAQKVQEAVEAAQDADAEDAMDGVVLHIGEAAHSEADEEASPVIAAPIRRVHFDLPKNTVHEIMPYREVYNGVHPKDFHFGKGLPAPGSCFFDPDAEHPILTLEGFRLRGYEYDSDDSDSDDDDDDDLEPKSWKGVCARRLGQAGVTSVPRPVLYALFLVLLFLRIFYDEIAVELQSGFPLADKLF